MLSGSVKSMFSISISLGRSSSNLGAIIGGVMACIVVICVLIIAIPLCICCYRGVGIGAKCRKRIYTPFSNVITDLPTTTTTTDVTTSTNMDNSSARAPSPPTTVPSFDSQQTSPPTEYPQKNPPSYTLQSPGEYQPQQQVDHPLEHYPIATCSLST